MGYQQDRDQTLPDVGTRVRITGLLAAHVAGAVGTVEAVGPGWIHIRYPHNRTGELRIVQLYRGEFKVLQP